MSEFVRFISERNFEDGLALRLQAGAVAVGDVCKIRFEDLDYRIKERPLRFAEAAISIVAKAEDNGFLRINYVFEALRAEGNNSQETALFNDQSIALERSNGMTFRTYLSDQPDSRWDDSLRELVDLESTIFVR